MQLEEAILTNVRFLSPEQQQAVLVERDRISASVLERLQVELSAEDAGIEIVALDQSIAFAIQQIDQPTVPKMPDRIIAATAYHLNLPLVTRDHKIRQLQTSQTIWWLNIAEKCKLLDRFLSDTRQEFTNPESFTASRLGR